MPNPAQWPLAAVALAQAAEGDASLAETIARGATGDQIRVLIQEQGAALVCADAPPTQPARAWPRVVHRYEAESRVGGRVTGWFNLAPCVAWPARSPNRYP